MIHTLLTTHSPGEWRIYVEPNKGLYGKIYLDGKKYRGEIALSSSGADIRHLGEYQRKSEAADAVQNLLLELSQPGARSYF